MGNFSSEEIESQYNLIKMLLAEPEKYKDAINAIDKYNVEKFDEIHFAKNWRGDNFLTI